MDTYIEFFEKIKEYIYENKHICIIDSIAIKKNVIDE